MKKNNFAPPPKIGGGKRKPNTGIGLIRPREITEEMKESYIDYAMSVIVSRALPDVRDGLKPVHRRILYTMLEDGLRYNAKFRKSATVVGSCLGRYHPHGDIAVYDSLARMAQDFSLRYPLIQGQGNFGCFTKDTKVKLTDGRSLSFSELIKEQKKGKKHWTFTFNPETKKIEITEIKNPRKTRPNEKIIKIALDNGEKIKCTLDHRFMLRNGSYKQAKDLKPDDSLMPAYFNIRRVRSHYNYLAVLQPFTGHYEFVHQLADKYNVKNKKVKKIQDVYILHHKDFNKFNNSPDNIERFTIKQHYKVHLAQAKNLWKEKGDEFREKQRESLKKYFNRPEIRKELSERMKKLWNDPTYRARYPKEHFEKMHKKLWGKPGIREFHREKIAKQRQNEEFRKKHIAGVIVSNKHRLKENPNMMKEMAEKAKISLKKNWQTPAYKEKVVKSKILGFVYSLLEKHSKITHEIYEKARTNNGVPKIEGALNYFNNFSEIVEKARKYNHRVIKTRILPKKEDVYDLTTEPWHNFLLDAGVFVHNSIDNDPPAAQRYTECKLSKIGEEMLKDIEKETVNFVDNYDGTRKEPQVLPSPAPQLLLNGCLGIAVGMATNIPPHNLSELTDAISHLIDYPKATTEELFKWIRGPDFPTGGQIFNQKEIILAYSQGKGPILVRGKAEVVEQEKTGRQQIIISEIPFQVQKSALVEQFANLVQEKKIEGVKDIRDESDREGMRIVIDLQREVFPQKILNRLYKFSDLQKTFHLNLLALVEGIQPRVLNLPETLNYFIEHRKEVVFRRTKYDLEKAKERTHILEGLFKALSNIDAVISTIRRSKDREEAKKNLMKRFKLTEIQANAILEIKLQQLARLERQKIEEELKQKRQEIKELAAILKSPQKIKEVIKKELNSLKENFGDERRTKIHMEKIGEIAEEDLIPQEETIITLTQGGYIKRINPKIYKLQKRGGKGILGMKTLRDDIVEHFFTANTHDSLLFFTDSGKVFKTQVYEIPEGSRVARGRGLLNFLEISPQEKVLSLFSLGKEDEALGIKYLVMVTENGIIKKTALSEFENLRKSGLIAITLKKDDLLKKAEKSAGEDQIILMTKKGQAIRFKEKQIRVMGRPAAGIKGIRLKKGDTVIGMDVIKAQSSKLKYRAPSFKGGGEDEEENVVLFASQNLKKEKEYLLVITENGFGKRTDLKEYRLQGRGGAGIKNAKITSKTGEIKASMILSGEEEDLIVISQKGQVIRTKISQIPKLSRATQGVRIMKLEEGDKVAQVACI